MESNNYLLSICVPTYNGASGYLKHVLDVLQIVASKHDNVEVIVSNNCSCDNTEELAKGYCCENFRYYVNEKNLGFNGNMIKLAYDYSQGTYIWFVGDDDIINIDYFEYIIVELSFRKADFYVLNYESVNSLDQIKSHLIQTNKFQYCSYGRAIDRNCNQGNAFATFMGSTICKKSLFCSIDRSSIGSGFNTYKDIFPNAFISATVFHDKQSAYTDAVAIYPIYRDKEWNNSDNSYLLNSKIIMDFYKYILNLGVPKTELCDTYERILYLNIEVGLLRIKSFKNVSLLFFECVLKSLGHPNVLKRIFQLVIK